MSKKAKNPKEAKKAQDVNMCEESKMEALSTEPTIRQLLKILECLANNEEHFKMERWEKQLCEFNQMTLKNLVECQTEITKDPKRAAERQEKRKSGCPTTNQLQEEGTRFQNTPRRLHRSSQITLPRTKPSPKPRTSHSGLIRVNAKKPKMGALVDRHFGKEAWTGGKPDENWMMSEDPNAIKFLPPTQMQSTSTKATTGQLKCTERMFLNAAHRFKT